MIIKTVKFSKKISLMTFVIFSIAIVLGFYFFSVKSSEINFFINWNRISKKKENTENLEKTEEGYIKWVDFSISYEALNLTSKLDIESHDSDTEINYNWIELLAYLACKNGGNFNNFKKADLDKLTAKIEKEGTMENLTKDLKNYDYYYESYNAVLGNFIGNYSIETEDSNGNVQFIDKYGIKAFLPIARNYGFSHYKDFGASRAYGFKRHHLGNDLMGSTGTPIVAVESGIVEHLGWNQYGGWRIGIRSFDGKRYYYYAHLRKDHPYAQNIYEGAQITAGDVIGYLGMTGYSTKENINNINVPHLHFGMQLIFDDSQVDGNNEIWIDVYNIIEFLRKNTSAVFMNNQTTKDYSRKYNFKELD